MIQRMALGDPGNDPDRPVRMTVVFHDGSERKKLDRVYSGFHPVETNAGPPMLEPHRIREEMGPCQIVEQRVISPAQCPGFLASAVVDRIRRKFEVNKPLPSASVEARLIAEELGCIGMSQSTDPTAPCYEP